MSKCVPFPPAFRIANTIEVLERFVGVHSRSGLSEAELENRAACSVHLHSKKPQPTRKTKGSSMSCPHFSALFRNRTAAIEPRESASSTSNPP